MAKEKKQGAKAAEDQTEDEQRQERERLAREANQNRNRAAVDRLNQIADNADTIKNEEENLEPLTDEVWDQGDPHAGRRRTRAEQLEQQEAEDAADDAAAEDQADDVEEDEAAVLARAEAADRDADAARDAGAEDSRKGAGGQIEYKLVVNGKVKWLTLAQLRATAGKVESADEYLQDAKGSATRASTDADSPDDAEVRRQAEAKEQADFDARKAHLKELHTKASMGDEAAIDELSEIQAGLSRVTPDVLRIVDQRVDARVTGRTDFERAVEWFEDEYSTELSTPTLKAYAARRDREMAMANPDAKPQARLKAVGEEMRQLRKDLGGTIPNKDGPTKQQRKQTMHQVPAAAGRERQADEGNEGESVQDAIANMARGRGQARAIKH